MRKYQRPLKFQHEALIIPSLAKGSTDNPSFDTVLAITATAGYFETTTILTYLRSWALLEKMPIVQLLKNFPAF
jgi:hypothetical protein